MSVHAVYGWRTNIASRVLSLCLVCMDSTRAMYTWQIFMWTILHAYVSDLLSFFELFDLAGRGSPWRFQKMVEHPLLQVHVLSKSYCFDLAFSGHCDL